MLRPSMTPTEDGATPVKPVVRRILVPTDLSQWAEGAVDYAIGLAAQLGAELRFFAVIDSPVIVTLIGNTAGRGRGAGTDRNFQRKLVEDARRILQRDVDRAAEQGVRAIGHVKLSEDGDREILAEARDGNVDLIVVMAPERRSLTEWLVGDTAEQVSHRAPCPVLLLRSRPRSRNG
jgi:nucleotide-binding universal stress UspA family protein